ncbi:MAG: glycosyltransferase, partial [Cyanobacteria bacterium P01_H01_bin.130]
MDLTGKLPLISVIVPAYNAAETLRSTLASVLTQTHEHLELWVIDDGSTDHTPALMAALQQEWQDDRLHYAPFENGGQAIARNRGIDLSRGEFVAFLDADDTWTPTKLEDQLAALIAYPQAAVAYSWTDYVDDDGKKLHQGSYVALGGNILAPLMVVNFLENGSNPLVRREAIAQVGLFKPELVPSEDWDLWIRLAEKFEFVAVPKVQILYRVSSTSQSANVRRLEKSCLACLQRAFYRNPLLRSLRRQSFGNLYKYLLHKALDGAIPTDRQSPLQRFLLAARLFCNLLIRCPEFLIKRLTLKTVTRLLLIMIYSLPVIGSLLAGGIKIGDRLTKVDALLGYIKLPTQPVKLSDIQS